MPLRLTAAGSAPIFQPLSQETDFTDRRPA